MVLSIFAKATLPTVARQRATIITPFGDILCSLFLWHPIIQNQINPNCLWCFPTRLGTSSSGLDLVLCHVAGFSKNAIKLTSA